ncbi:MAG: Crp/Fnr family transcriptional regulator [Methylomonas sp.]|nr:Crp/Fnr family transcriptional regulator [Methylomonas sp.]
MPISPLILKQFDLFKQLPEEAISLLGEQTKLAEAPRRKVVMEKNQRAHSLGLLLDGRLQGIDLTLDGREAGLYFVEPYDFFGELSVIDQLPAPEFVIALAPSRFLMVPTPVMHQLINTYPQVSTIINTRLARRLRESLAQRTLLTMPTPLQRVCAQLLQLSKQSSAGTSDIVFAPTHQEIAIMINTTRETVTRVFQKLQTDGVIVRQGNTLHILKIQYLSKAANGEPAE